MSCGSCRYFDENETWGQKGHCDWIGIYVYADDDTCSHYERRGSGGGCYLTSACCEYRQLPDDCRELNAMRRLRDDYLRTTEEGHQIMADYYRSAPAIVERIDASPKRDEAYGLIFSTVNECAGYIDRDDFESAKNTYLEMVDALEELLS